MSVLLQSISSASWQYVVRKATTTDGTALYDPNFTERITRTFAVTNDEASDLYVCGVLLNNDGNVVQVLTAQGPRGDANEFIPVFQITNARHSVLGGDRLYLTRNTLEHPVSIETFLAAQTRTGVNRVPDVNISGHLVTALQELQKSLGMVDQILSGGIPTGLGTGRAAPDH